MAAHIIPKKFNEDDFTEVNHIRAMEEELSDLVKRCDGLSGFINSSEFKKRISDEELQELTKSQLRAMKDYRDILFKRIRMFKNEK